MGELEFWFDFASPYSWLAAMRVEPLAARANRKVAYRAFLLGPVFEAIHGTNDSPFNRNAPRLRYLWLDVEREAARQGLTFRMQATFPRTSVLAARVALLAQDEPWVGAFVRGIFSANFSHDEAIGERDVVARVLLQVAPGSESLLERAGAEDTKNALRARTHAAQARGLFGAPTFFADGKLYWGNDRLEQALFQPRFASYEEARTWAEEWAEAWSKQDVARVLTLFTSDVLFESPLAERLLGQGRVVGKDALEQYWTAAVRAAGTFRFRVERVLYDPLENELVVLYDSTRGGETKRKTEHFRFRGELVYATSAFDGP
jgi:2-hydroxychromene-2-carboxylate isomerase